MPALRDIPTDVIQFVIFPFLDPISGFIANETLAPSKEIEYRIVKRIPKDRIVAHGMLIESKKMAPSLNKFINTRCPKVIISVLAKILHGGTDLYLQHNSGFRQTTIDRMMYLLRDESYPVTYTHGFKKGLQSLGTKINERVNRLPFIKQLTLKGISY
jgi:hypothetical protein